MPSNHSFLESQTTGFQYTSLGKVVDPRRPITYGIVLPGENDPDGILLVRAGDYSNGWQPTERMFRVQPAIDESYRRSRINGGDLLLTIVGSVGNSARVPLHIRHANITQQTARIAINEEVADPHFYSFVLQCNYLQQQIRRIVKSGVQPSINLADVGLLRVPLPSLPVQKAIAGILMTWDRGIRQLTDLIAAKLRFKQGLMQQLLTGKRRFKGFGEPANELGHIPEGWQRLKASELFGNFTQKKNDGEDLLSVTQDRGVIPRTMLEGKVVMPESGTDGYKLVEPGDFVISLRSFQGGLEYSQYRGLVSPAYTVLKPRQTINDAFFRHYFKSYDFIQRLAVAVIGIRDGKQISYSDFESVKLPKPPLDEQRKIAAALDVVDKEVDLLRRQLEALKQQKKGLMQKLLTGEVRVHTGRTENEHAQL